MFENQGREHGSWKRHMLEVRNEYEWMLPGGICRDCFFSAGDPFDWDNKMAEEGCISRPHTAARDLAKWQQELRFLEVVATMCQHAAKCQGGWCKWHIKEVWKCWAMSCSWSWSWSCYKQVVGESSDLGAVHTRLLLTFLLDCRRVEETRTDPWLLSREALWLKVGRWLMNLRMILAEAFDRSCDAWNCLRSSMETKTHPVINHAYCLKEKDVWPWGRSRVSARLVL